MGNQTSSAKATIRFLLLVGIGVGITVATGLVHGRLTQRWGPAPNLQAAAKSLRDFPKSIGDWQLQTDEPVEDSVLRMLSCAGYVNRKYVNLQSAQTVWIAIFVGPPGPIAVHTPEICYSSRDYDIHEPRKEVAFTDEEGRQHSFWSLSFRSKDSSLDQMRVCYAWRTRDAWKASPSPRFEYGGQDLLFKLQMSSVVPANVPASQDPCQQFLKDSLQSGWQMANAANP